jgi:hypothetical protein
MLNQLGARKYNENKTLDFYPPHSPQPPCLRHLSPDPPLPLSLSLSPLAMVGWLPAPYFSLSHYFSSSPLNSRPNLSLCFSLSLKPSLPPTFSLFSLFIFYCFSIYLNLLYLNILKFHTTATSKNTAIGSPIATAVGMKKFIKK